METFNVSEIAIESGLFIKSLSDIESVAYCICDLLNYYEYKTEDIQMILSGNVTALVYSTIPIANCKLTKETI